MFAIINDKGKQYRVSVGDKLRIDRIGLDDGAEYVFSNVVLLNNGSQDFIGTPIISGASVISKVIRSFKDKKIIIFKKKRRQNYRRKNGHRQEYTIVQIEEIKNS